MLETIYASLIGAAVLIAGLVFAFFKGRSSSKTETKVKQWEVIAEVQKTVQESDNAVNSQDRASLIESLSADSVRRHP